MIEKLHDVGLKSEDAYIAGFASIGLSFLAWATSVKAEDAGTDRADGWGFSSATGPLPSWAWATRCVRTRSKGARVGDYQHSQAVDAPAGQLFDYLSDVGTSPRLRRD
jgi:hypothetical protein